MTISPRAMYVADAGCWCFYLFSDGWVRKALHALKYGGIPQAATILVQRIAEEHIIETLLPKTARVVWIPVPIGNKRRKERGYNQVELLVSELQRVCGGEIWKGALRKRNQESLVGSSRDERTKKVAGAFSGGKEMDTKDAFVVLVDDVVTTGATLIAARKVLEQHGVHVSLALAIAHED